MNVSELLDTDNCTGCKACLNTCFKDAIIFTEDEYGFTYPSIKQELCVDCGKCVQVCKRISEVEKRVPKKAFAATNKDAKTLMNSSSGGVFSVLAEYILNSGGLVCGCVYDGELKPIHICTEKHSDFIRMRRSKYVQSDVGTVYREVKKGLEQKRQVLFSGTPCQVAGLNAYLNKKYDNLITIDLVCHGVPPYRIFKEFLNYLENKYKVKIVDFNFRSKKYGWQRFSLEFTDDKGKVKNIGKQQEFYYPAFSHGFIFRNSCFNCSFACPERVGDFTIADFWGHEQVELACDKKYGVSICFLNTDLAVEWLPVLSEQLTLDEIDYKTAVAGNTCLRHPTPMGAKREKYLTALKENNIPKIAEAYNRSNRKKIMLERIKLLIPVGLFVSLKKRQKKKRK